MKPILISILTLILATSLHAQQYQIGLNSEAVFSRDLLVLEDYHSNQHMFIANTLSGQYDNHHWQYGFSAGYRTGSVSASFFTPSLICTYSTSPKPPTLVTVHGSLTEIPLRLFANRKVTFKRMELYFGPFLGYSTASDKYDVVESGVHNVQIYHHNWLVGGIQTGGTYFVKKHFGINAGITTEYNMFFPI